VHWAPGIPRALCFLQNLGAKRRKRLMRVCHSGAMREHRTRNLKIPGLVLRTIPECQTET